MRSVLAAGLIVVACVLVPVGAVGSWAAWRLADTDAYVAAMAPLAADPAVRRDITDAVTDAVTDALTDESGQEAASAADTGTGAPPPHQAVRAFVHAAVWSFTGTRNFRSAWKAANQAAHAAVIRALRTERDAAVRVDLAPITAQVKGQLVSDGVPFAERIPVTHIDITVLRARDMAAPRKGFHMVHVLGLWVPVAAAVFAVGGMLLAVRRRRAVTATALGMALGAVALIAAIAAGRSLALGDLPPDVSRAAAGAVYDALTETLRVTAWLILGAGTGVALLTWLSRYRTRRRRDPAPPPGTAPEPSRVRA